MLRYRSLFHYVFLLGGVCSLTISSLEASGPTPLTAEERISNTRAMYTRFENLLNQIPDLDGPHSLTKKLGQLKNSNKSTMDRLQTFKNNIAKNLNQSNALNVVQEIKLFAQDDLAERIEDLKMYLNSGLIKFDPIEDFRLCKNKLVFMAANTLLGCSNATTDIIEFFNLQRATQDIYRILFEIENYFDNFNRKIDDKIFDIRTLYDTLFELHRRQIAELVRTQEEGPELVDSFSRPPTEKELRILAPVQSAFPGAEILVVDAQSYLKGLGTCGLKDPGYFLHLLDASAEEFQQSLGIYFFPVVEISPEARPLIVSYCHAAETDLYYRRILVGLMANLQTPLSLRRMMLEFPLVALKLAAHGRCEESAFDMPRLKIQGPIQGEQGSYYKDDIVCIDTTRGDCEEYPCFMTESPQVDQKRLYENIGVGIAKLFDTVSHEFVHRLAEFLSNSKFGRSFCPGQLAEQFQNITFFNQTDPTKALYFWDNQHETFQIPGVAVLNADGQLIDVCLEENDSNKTVVETIVINTLCDWAGQVDHNLSPTFSHKSSDVLSELAHAPKNPIKSIYLSAFSKSLLSFYKYLNDKGDTSKPQ